MDSLVSEAITAAKDGFQGNELLGECPYNARRLHDELEHRGIHNHIVIGGFAIPDKSHRPTSMNEAEKAGSVHWWTEALVADSWFTIDIASEVPGRKGETIYTKSRPASYIPFEVYPPDTEVFASR